MSSLDPDGKQVKVEPLTDEDRRTLVRWIDLGCPIDLDYDPKQLEKRGRGWMLDDNRPTLTLNLPAAGAGGELGRVLVGMYDYYTGLDMESFRVVADFALDGVPAGENLAPRFRARSRRACGNGSWPSRSRRRPKGRPDGVGAGPPGQPKPRGANLFGRPVAARP